MAKDLRKLIRALEQQGARVVRGGGNHYKVFRGPQLVATMSSSPGDHRSYKNTLGQLRRGGFNV